MVVRCIYCTFVRPLSVAPIARRYRSATLGAPVGMRGGYSQRPRRIHRKRIGTAVLDERTFRELNDNEWVGIDGRSLNGATQ